MPRASEKAVPEKLGRQTPTAAVVMGALALGHVPYDKWVKYVWKLILYFLLLTLAFLVVGAWLG